MGAGQNAFSARRSITMESLPPEKSSTGRSNSAATSRITKMLSASSESRWEKRYAATALIPPPRREVRRRLSCGHPHGLIQARERSMVQVPVARATPGKARFPDRGRNQDGSDGADGEDGDGAWNWF